MSEWPQYDLKTYIDEINLAKELFSEQLINYAELMGYKYVFFADGSQGWAKWRMRNHD